MPVTLSTDYRWAVVHAYKLLGDYLPYERQRSGHEELVMDRLAMLVSEIEQPLCPIGSEAFMADFIAMLVDGSGPHPDIRARQMVEGH